MNRNTTIAIIGGGPSGLIAAEKLSYKGHKVTVYDRMPSLARKFLMAGRGGLNITHSEPMAEFLSRYNEAENWLTPHLNNFTPKALRQWCHDLGEETFIGTSGRVFPRSMKAAPLLRAWLQRLASQNVEFKLRHQWLGWDGDRLLFSSPAGQINANADATLLALGGASWPRLGSDGSWVDVLAAKSVEISALRPANSGFMVEWSDVFSTRFAGHPIKNIELKYGSYSKKGELMITAKGIEGGAVYALSSYLREGLLANGSATLVLDLKPNMAAEQLAEKLSSRKKKQSLSSFLKQKGFSPAAISLLREVAGNEKISQMNAAAMAQLIKSISLQISSVASIERAISTAGGIKSSELDKNFMLKQLPGVFATGEMLDWEAPTGGYLLQACFSLGIAAANGIDNYLNRNG